MATLPQRADGPGQMSSLTGTPQRTDRKWDLSLLFHRTNVFIRENSTISFLNILIQVHLKGKHIHFNSNSTSS